MVLNLADPGNFRMVVKDFGRKEVDLTREQHTHHQGAQPVLVPTFSPPSQLEGRSFFVWTESTSLILPIDHNTK
jgi:hypothetical protein